MTIHDLSTMLQNTTPTLTSPSFSYRKNKNTNEFFSPKNALEIERLKNRNLEPLFGLKVKFRGPDHYAVLHVANSNIKPLLFHSLLHILGSTVILLFLFSTMAKLYSKTHVLDSTIRHPFNEHNIDSFLIIHIFFIQILFHTLHL